MPFVGIYLDGERQFDVELWVGGTLRSIVPARRPEVEVVYDHIEGIATDPPLPALPPSSFSTPGADCPPGTAQRTRRTIRLGRPDRVILLRPPTRGAVSTASSTDVPWSRSAMRKDMSATSMRTRGEATCCSRSVAAV
jgi:hypothetical protein